MSTTLTASTTAKSAITSFDGTELIRVIQGGVAKKATSLQLGALAAIAYALTGSHVTVTAQAAGTIPITLKGAASQSANLTEWQNSAGTVLSSVSAAGVFSGPRLALSGNGAASTPVLSGTGTWFTGGSATTTKPYFLLEPSGTTSTGWSTSGTGIGVNAASGFAGNLLDLQLNGTRVQSVSATGVVILQNSTNSTAAWEIRNAAGSGFGGWDSTNRRFAAGGTFGSSSFSVSSATGLTSVYDGGGYGFCSGATADGAVDLVLRRDAANILALRNSTSAQTFRVYNTYTDASNYERGIFDWNATANTLTIGTQAAGTGTVRNIALVGGNLTIASAVATPAGGSTSARLLFGTTAGFGIYYGSGAPSVSAAKGSKYMRSDGSGTTDREYVNTDGGTTWAAVVTVA